VLNRWHMTLRQWAVTGNTDGLILSVCDERVNELKGPRAAPAAAGSCPTGS